MSLLQLSVIARIEHRESFWNEARGPLYRGKAAGELGAPGRGIRFVKARMLKPLMGPIVLKIRVLLA